MPFVLARRQIVSNMILPVCLLLFYTTIIVLPQIQAAAGALIGGANIFVFGTVYSFFVFFGRDDEWDWDSF